MLWGCSMSIDGTYDGKIHTTSGLCRIEAHSFMDGLGAGKAVPEEAEPQAP